MDIEGKNSAPVTRKGRAAATAATAAKKKNDVNKDVVNKKTTRSTRSAAAEKKKVKEAEELVVDKDIIEEKEDSNEEEEEEEEEEDIYNSNENATRKENNSITAVTNTSSSISYDNKEDEIKEAESLLFAPYRELGMVIDIHNVPFTLNRLGNENFIVCSIGKSFHIFRGDKLTVAMVSKQIPILSSSAKAKDEKKANSKKRGKEEVNDEEKDERNAPSTYINLISPVSGDDKLVYTVTGKQLIKWNRANAIGHTKVSNESNVKLMLVLRSTATTNASASEDQEQSGKLIKIITITESGEMIIWNDKGGYSENKKAMEIENKIQLSNNSSSKKNSDDDDNEDSGMKSTNAKKRKTTTAKSKSLKKDDDKKDTGLVNMVPPTAILHPNTYLNKVVVAGGEEGNMQLWNIRTGQLVHTFKNTWKSAIRTIEQSPAIDVVAIGLEDGRVIIFNLRYDCEIATFRHTQLDEEGKEIKGCPITSISFRTDYSNPSAIKNTSNTSNMMISSDESGLIAVWNLDEKQLVVSLPNCHRGSISKVAFYPNEPIFVSSGATDNSMKMWIFDQSDGTPRLLKSREGHLAPPSRIRYYPIGTVVSTMTSGADAACCQIISAASDQSLRVFHTAREQQSIELSQKILIKKPSKYGIQPLESKLPQITSIAAMETKERDWANILTAHRDESSSFMWNFESRTIGPMMLRPDSDGELRGIPTTKAISDRLSASKLKGLPVNTCVAISLCGNYGFTGTKSGIIYRYNMQSGVLRGQYPPLQGEDADPIIAEMKKKYKDLSEGEKKRIRAKAYDPSNVMLLVSTKSKKASSKNDESKIALKQEGHIGSVAGVGVGALNRTLISAGEDGTIRIWDLVKFTLIHVIQIGSPITMLEMSRDATMCAVVCKDKSVIVVDATSSFNIIRRFKNVHKAEITDIGFDGTSRLLFTSSLDKTIRVWDLPTAKCVDWLLFDDPVTSISMSPTGEYLAISYANSVGIYLWANKIHFGQSKPDRMCRSPIYVGSSSAYSHENTNNDDEDSEKNASSDSSALKAATTSSMITLSDGASRSRWFTLAHLDIIKARNKPIEPPKKPESAPFFLPSLHGQTVATLTANPAAVISSSKDESNSKPISKISKGSHGALQSLFRSKLWQLLEMANAESENMQANMIDIDDEDENGPKDQAKMLTSTHFEEFVNELKSLSPSGVDYELNIMTHGAEDEDGSRILYYLLNWILLELEAGTNFELVQAILNRVLVLHNDSLTTRDELLDIMNSKIRPAQRKAWQRLQSLFHKNICLVRFFSHLNMS